MRSSFGSPRARTAAFLCGTFALALALVLVLDPDDDDDDLPVIPSSSAPVQPAAKPTTAASKPLKVAKSSKLKPKKTAVKKRSKRVFQLSESAPPLQSNPRPRRGFAPTQQAVTPALVMQVGAPDLTLDRLPPVPTHLPHALTQTRRQLTRGPPPLVRS